MNRDLIPGHHEWANHERVIVFDGFCNWCNFWVNFTIARDPHGKFMLGTLQSEQARQILATLQLPTEDFDTFILLERGRVYLKSTAALRILRQLSGLWPSMFVCMLIPRFLRDMIYDFIARHRYGWMGKAETCRVPTPSELARFL